MEDLPDVGEFCLYDFDIVQFNGTSKDSQDSYYKLIYWGGRISHSSQCNAKLIRIKFMIPEKDYLNLVRLWNLNKSLWNKKPSSIFMNAFGDYILRLKNGELVTLDEAAININQVS